MRGRSTSMLSRSFGQGICSVIPPGSPIRALDLRHQTKPSCPRWPLGPVAVCREHLLDCAGLWDSLGSRSGLSPSSKDGERGPYFEGASPAVGPVANREGASRSSSRGDHHNGEPCHLKVDPNHTGTHWAFSGARYRNPCCHRPSASPLPGLKGSPRIVGPWPGSCRSSFSSRG